MSGVFGFIDTTKKLNPATLTKAMQQTMCHKPWFIAERMVDEEHGLGIGRIGIGIFNRASQPVWNEDRSIALVMAGELYRQGGSNSNEKLSDEQYALALYESRGSEFVKQLNGMFIFAIWDKNHRQVLLFNDKLGLYPTYYTHSDRKLIFAPEVKAILCDGQFEKKLDQTALAEYVRFQYLLGDKTFFKDIKLLPNASILRYDLTNDMLTLTPYWGFEDLPQTPLNISFDDAVEEAGRLLRKSVEKITEKHHDFGIYLSAGMDSRLILGLLEKNLSPITTLTFGLEGSRDMKYAAHIAKRAGTRHYTFPFKDGKWVQSYAPLHLELTEGFHSWIHMHGISIGEQVRDLMQVNLSGFGGQEINWENPELLYAPNEMAFEHHVYQGLLKGTTWPSLDDDEEQLLYSDTWAPQMRGLAFESLRAELKKFNHLPTHLRANSFSRSTPDRRMYQYHTVFSRAFIEQSFPFCDQDYIQFVYSLPPELLFNRKLRKAVISRFIPRLARIPYDKDNLPITNSESLRLFYETIQRGKRLINRLTPTFSQYTTLYADYENWLRGELRPWGEELLLSERTLQRGIFNPQLLRSLWERHLSQIEVNMIGKFAPLMSYEMMLRRFCD